MSLNNVKVVKKDGTKEEFNVQKVVVAVNKSAYRALIKFSQKDIDFICQNVHNTSNCKSFCVQAVPP